MEFSHRLSFNNSISNETLSVYTFFSLSLVFGVFFFSVKGLVSTGEMIVSSPKYNVQETSLSLYETRMTLTIRKFQKDDIGSYRCIAKNSLGEVDSSIRLYGKCYINKHFAFEFLVTEMETMVLVSGGLFER